MGNLRTLARVIRDGRLWRGEHLEFALRGLHHRQYNAVRGFSDRDHLLAAATWLRTAQDASGDGGVSGRYFLDRGWSSSYPETTGYILPTLLALESELGDSQYANHARRCLEFLLPLQLDSGAFPGGEIAENRTKPSLFNTAQILHGLTAWHRATGGEPTLAAARRAADWMVSIQDPDGAYRRHCYNDVATTYSTHASCWLAEFGAYTGDDRYLHAAGRHLDWALTHADPETGWLDLCGFGTQDHQARTSVTHTSAYSRWGVLFTSEVLGRADGIEVVRRAAEGIARRLELSRRLPGELDHQWRPKADYVCLTGNAQMALIWMRLHEGEPNLRFLNAALKAIDGIKLAQSLDNPDPGIRGGVAGSDPVWGGYIYNALPNWAAKYFIDALLEKKRALARLEELGVGHHWAVPADVPRQLPGGGVQRQGGEVRVVLYTSLQSSKPAEMMAAWGAMGIRPSAIGIEAIPEESVSRRLRRKLRDEGIDALLRKLFPGRHSTAPGFVEAPAAPLEPPADLARRLGIPAVRVESLNSLEGLQAVRALAPDVAVHAGAGILRAPLLEIPRLGTVNAHMGILPHYRGMNVSEWAALSGDPVGCTVHVVDPGIDTGPILCVREVDPGPAGNISQLRRLVDKAQVELLGEVLQYVVRSGELPPCRPQERREGVQFFRMHDDLKAILERRLAGFLP